MPLVQSLRHFPCPTSTFARPQLTRHSASTLSAIMPSPPPPRKLKILMLHGYTQSGPLFHAKTRALEKALQKAFLGLPPPPHKPLPGTLPAYPGGIELVYPTGPLRLRASDIPGYQGSEVSDAADEESEAYAWWRKEAGTGSYKGLEAGFTTIAEAIKTAGEIDGVIGFSQGAAAAALVASLLEDGRPEAFAKADGITFPASFGTSSERVNPPLKFAVAYSGFYAPNTEYRAFYEPQISTKFLHVIGSLDSVVEEARSLALVKACGPLGQTTVYHPGGHFVPIGKEMVGRLVGFIREACGPGDVSKVEENISDMDVPF